MNKNNIQKQNIAVSIILGSSRVSAQTNRKKTASPDPLARTDRCIFLSKNENETFIFVNGHSYPVKVTIIQYPNTKIKVSNFIRIYRSVPDKPLSLGSTIISYCVLVVNRFFENILFLLDSGEIHILLERESVLKKPKSISV